MLITTLLALVRYLLFALPIGFFQLSIILFLVALATPDWAIIKFVNTELEQVHVQLGVWGEWRTRQNDTNTTGLSFPLLLNTCIAVEWIPHFPAPPERVLRLADTDLQRKMSHHNLSTNYLTCRLLPISGGVRRHRPDSHVGEQCSRRLHLLPSSLHVQAIGSQSSRGHRLADRQRDVQTVQGCVLL
jgi:hypothetical protein